jgi:hypothetical protein
MTTNKNKRVNQAGNVPNMSAIVKKRNAMNVAVEEYNAAVEQYKVENPDIDVEAILSKQKKLLPALDQISNRELDKFITFAKNQGQNMSFQDMETGVLVAGRKDMQNGLTEILDSIKFTTPVCPECNEKMTNRGRSKKKV